MSLNLNSSHFSRKVHRGFTLIEMLAVIAIIAVLAAILIPVLGAARNSVHKSKCANNQRQLAMGALAYAYENNGRLPATDRSVTPNVRWMFQVGPYVGSGGDPSTPNAGPLTQTFQCPRDRARVAAFADESYLSNGWLAVSYLHMLPFPLDRREGGVPITRLPAVEKPGAHPMLVCASGNTGTSFYQNNARFAATVQIDPEGLLHGDGVNVTYYDGSVRFIKNPTWTSIRGFPDQ